MQVHLDAGGLLSACQRFDRNMQAEGAKALAATAQMIVNGITTGGYWTRRTGDAAESLQIRRLDQLRFQVFSGSKVLGWINNGTRAHTIRPKAATGFKGPLRQSQSRRKRGTGDPRKMLRFSVNGAIVFARQVKHPGTKRTSFERIEARRAEFVTMPAMLGSAVSRAVRMSGL